jgi:uncharacterized protein (TIGR02996 family)
LRGESAFLRAIREHPEEDEPRLEYAAWLEKHGQPVRAKVIQIQCQLAKEVLSDEEIKKLHGTYNQIWIANIAHWEDLLTRKMGSELEWRYNITGFDRGIPNSIRFKNARDFLDCSDKLFTLIPLQKLDIDDFGDVSAEEFFNCKNLSKITSLTIWDAGKSSFGREGAEAVAQCRYLSNLKSLSIFHGEISNRGLAALAGSNFLSHLGELSLPYNEIQDIGVSHLAKSTCLSNLTKLALRDNPINERGLRMLTCPASTLKMLETLDLRSTSIMDLNPDEFVDSVKLSKLKEVFVAGCHLQGYSPDVQARINDLLANRQKRMKQ